MGGGARSPVGAGAAGAQGSHGGLREAARMDQDDRGESDVEGVGTSRVRCRAARTGSKDGGCDCGGAIERRASGCAGWG